MNTNVTATNNTTATNTANTATTNTNNANNANNNATTNYTNNTTFPGDSPIPKNDKPTGGNSLNNEAFMKLFLEQLKNQDPTAPMETQEILTQTAQLTQVEAQEKMKTAMEKMTTAMESMQKTNEKTIEAQEKLIQTQDNMLKTMQTLAGNITDGNILNSYSAVDVIGKIAETGYSALTLSNNDKVKFSLYFDKPIDASKGDPKVTITTKAKDKDGKDTTQIVKEISLKEYNGKSGYIEFEWDTRDDGGSFVRAGEYKISAEYNLDSNTNKYLTTEMGRGEVQSIVYDKGVPYIKLGDHFIMPITAAQSFYPKK